MAEGQTNNAELVKQAALALTNDNFKLEGAEELAKQVQDLMIKDPSIKTQLDGLANTREKGQEEIEKQEKVELIDLLEDVVKTAYNDPQKKIETPEEISRVAKELVDEMAMRRLETILLGSNFFKENKEKIGEVKKIISQYIDEKASKAPLAMRLQFGAAINKYLLDELFFPDVPGFYQNGFKNDPLFLTNVIRVKLEESPLVDYDSWIQYRLQLNQEMDPVFGRKIDQPYIDKMSAPAAITEAAAAAVPLAPADQEKEAKKGPAEKVQDQITKFWAELKAVKVDDIKKSMGDEYTALENKLKEIAANPGAKLDELGRTINEKLEEVKNADPAKMAEYGQQLLKNLIPGAAAVYSFETVSKAIKDYTPFDEWLSDAGLFLGIKIDKDLINEKFPDNPKRLKEDLARFKENIEGLENTDQASKDDITNKIDSIEKTLEGDDVEKFVSEKETLENKYNVVVDQLNRYIEVDNRRQEVEGWKRQLVEKVRSLTASDASYKPVNDLLGKIDRDFEEDVKRFVEHNDNKAKFDENISNLRALVDAQLPPAGDGEGLGDKLLLMQQDEGFIGTLKSILKSLLDTSWGTWILKKLDLVTDAGLEKANARKVGGKLEFRPRAKAREVLENTLHINQNVWDTKVNYEANGKSWNKELNKLTPAEFINIDLNTINGLDAISKTGLENLKTSLKNISGKSSLDFTRLDVLFFIRSKQNMGYWKTDNLKELFSAQVEEKKTKSD